MPLIAPAIVYSGSTRLVLLIGHLAIKVPKPWPRDRRERGRRGNQIERQMFSEHASDMPELCPVLRADPRGWWLVMRRARMMTDGEFDRWFADPDYPDHYFPGEPGWGGSAPYEHKPPDWGVLDGRPVVVDYAIRAH